MKRNILTFLTTGLFLFSMVGFGSATSISSFDLSAFDFDITSYYYTPVSRGLDRNAIASGTSNGIGWTISPTNIYSGLTKINGTFQFDSLPITTDTLHVSYDFTITFDEIVDELLVALDNDNLQDSANFGLTPVEYTGLTLSGTQLALTVPARGGLALFKNVNSL